MNNVVLAWKNIWRNPLRSGVVTAAVTLGLFSGVFSVAFMNGMGIQTVSAVISRQTAHIQLHDRAFAAEPLPARVLPDADSVVAALQSWSCVQSVAPRLSVTAMATTAKTAVGVTVKGVDVEAEKKISLIYQDIVDGGYFTSSRKNSAVIGKKLADRLGLKIKSKLVITTQAADGELTGGAFRVAGIFTTNNSTFDGTVVFVNKQDAARLIGLPGQAVHEVAVLLDDKSHVDSVATLCRTFFPHSVVQTWSELVPEVGMIESMMGQMMYIFVFVILIALSFGIVNTMLMAVLERKREFGMLMAVGMSSGRIFMMVLVETIMLSLTGGSIGMAFGGLTVLITAKSGINLGAFGEGLKAMGYNPMVYPFIDAVLFAGISCMVMIVAVAAALYPAAKAIGLNPADAVRCDT